MRSVTRTQQRGRAQQRDEIVSRLSAAVERLYAGGTSFTNLSVERLVKQAGLSRTTFYVYFEDKGEMLVALTDRAVGALVDTTRFWWDLPPDSGRDDLRHALRHTHDVYLPNRGVMASVVEMASYDALVRERYDEIVARSIAEAADHISEGIRDGWVQPELDPQRTAAWLCWMIEQGLYEATRPEDAPDLEEWLTALTAIIWNTLYRGVH